MTHICGQTKDGKFRVQRKTIRKRLTEKLQAVKLELRKRMHEPISVQGRWVVAVIRGYFGYHAIPGWKHLRLKLRACGINHCADGVRKQN